MAVSPKHQAFIDHYLVDLNASRAYVLAGYTSESPDAHAARLMADPEIKAAIASALEKRAKRVHLQADAVLRELADLVHAPISEDMPASAKVRAVELAMKHLGISGAELHKHEGAIDLRTLLAKPPAEGDK